MFTFEKIILGDGLLEELNQNVDSCIQYRVKEEDKVIGNVYASRRVTFIILPPSTFRVERVTRIFKKRDHKMFNHASGEHVATFEFPDWQTVGNLKCYLNFTGSGVYSFTQNNAHRSFFKPKTWELYRYDMRYNDVLISYFMNSSNGEIEANNYEDLLPILSGLFIIDEGFRVTDENSG